MKKLINTCTLSLLLLSGVLLSCSKNTNDLNNPNPTPGSSNFLVKTEMYGYKVVPTNSSIAAAFFNGSYNASNKTLSYTITYRDLIPLAVHIHKGSNIENGPVVFSLSENGGPASGSIVLTDQQASDLVTGKYYVDVHTSIFPDGEVRGQLAKEN